MWNISLTSVHPTLWLQNDINPAPLTLHTNPPALYEPDPVAADSAHFLM